MLIRAGCKPVGSRSGGDVLCIGLVGSQWIGFIVVIIIGASGVIGPL